MDAEINYVIYMELNSGPKIANSTCGKTIDVETIDRDSTVLQNHVSILAKSLIISFQYNIESVCFFYTNPVHRTLQQLMLSFR